MINEYYPEAIMDIEYDTCEVCDMHFMPKKQKELNVLYDTKKDEVVCICDKCVQVTDLAAFEWVTYNQEIINQFLKLKQ